MSKHADLEWAFIDASHVRAHQHAAGIKHQALSKSSCGKNSKIHLAVDANGTPIEFIIEDGKTYDVKVAPDLIDGLDLKNTEILYAERGYDSESLRAKINSTGTRANIPRRRNSNINNTDVDWYLYKIRHLIENAFARLK